MSEMKKPEATKPVRVSRAELQALDPTVAPVAHLTEAGHEGIFCWNAEFPHDVRDDPSIYYKPVVI